MDGTDLPDWIEDTFDFPVDRETVVDRAGDLEVEGPGQEGSESLSTVLDRSSTETYQSETELLNDIQGQLGDEYVGRKYYDDRSGGAPGQERDDSDESF